jgi:hypothetical protein
MLKVNIEISEIEIGEKCQLFTTKYDNGKSLSGNLYCIRFFVPVSAINPSTGPIAKNV